MNDRSAPRRMSASTCWLAKPALAASRRRVQAHSYLFTVRSSPPAGSASHFCTRTPSPLRGEGWGEGPFSYARRSQLTSTVAVIEATRPAFVEANLLANPASTAGDRRCAQTHTCLSTVISSPLAGAASHRCTKTPSPLRGEGRVEGALPRRARRQAVLKKTGARV